ncbi:MAG: hypothetical protein RBT02_00670, partial [Bacteroidales bacterium]|nr:hypothetical protein [Bacteroidales bacterium]
MKTVSVFFAFMFLSVAAVFSQNAGTLKIFSEEPVAVYVDEVQYPTYDAISLAPGTHYVKALNKDGAKIYSNIVTITAGEITSVLIDASGALKPS